MKRFMSIDRMARAFMDHAFRVLGGRLGAKPTFIYIEEASFLLNNPLFCLRSMIGSRRSES
jgi:type IV secretion system protein VirB4